MKNRIDNILLGLLWLLAATLATSFWFNTKFGFNIFSAPHWQYLSHMQASHTPVTPVFYISLGVAVFLTISGMYLLLQPNGYRFIMQFKKNKNASAKAKASKKTAPLTQPSTKPAKTQKPEPTNPKLEPIPVPLSDTNPAPQQYGPQRPPRLNLPQLNTNNNIAVAPQAPASSPKKGESAELRSIFESAGYTVKKSPFIYGFQPGLLAIGTNETLWIGAIDTDTQTLHQAMDKLNEVFTDTLENIFININGFIINAPDAETTEYKNILQFASLDDLSQYIQEHRNTKPNESEQENFDAYSEYIDTVIGYIGTL